MNQTEQTKEEIEYNEKTTELIGLSNGIAQQLTTETGRTWTVENPRWSNSRWVDIGNCEGKSIQVEIERKPGKPDRVLVSGNYPFTKNTRNAYETCNCSWLQEKNPELPSKPPKITVALSRGISVIVHEIQERFFPAYDILFTVMQKEVQEDNEYQKGKRDTADKLLSLWPKLQEDTRRDTTVLEIHGERHGYGGEFTVNSENSVCFKLRSMPLDLAERILETLKQYYKRHPGTTA